MEVREDHLQTAGVVQGGLVVTLADHAIYLAVRSLLAPGEASVTVELKVDFIAPEKDGELIAEARVVSRGNRLLVGHVDVTNHLGELVATGIGSYMVRRGGR